jgi:predicted nucleotidyltransferase component of viral defense system
MKQSRFFLQSKLMVRCIAPVAEESCFGLKGGTAINLFIRDLPRLSVDIDLTYLPLDPRDLALENIGLALLRITEKILKQIPGSKVQQTFAKGETKRVTKLVVSLDGQLIKIEPNEILRGSVFGTERRKLVANAEKFFEAAISISVLSIGDLYGGKLCAALDRQHPRDIFDMKILLENEGITDAVRKAFVVYLAGHNRPMNELIDPTRKDIAKIYQSDFKDMAQVEVSFEDLLKTRERYIQQIKKDLNNDERQFLLSLKLGTPKWSLLGVSGVEALPGVQWKLANIKKMKKDKHFKQVELLRRKLSL